MCLVLSTLQFQANVEKTFKAKQAQETYVAKAKERYEQDCHRVNSYTAQQTLVQGKELERIMFKLDRAQSTVHANERDYANYTKVLADTVQKWDVEWKNFCDQCQDLEEERIEFMKDNVWAYANAVSTVCVAEDDVRISLQSWLKCLTGRSVVMREDSTSSRTAGSRKGSPTLRLAVRNRIEHPRAPPIHQLHNRRCQPAQTCHPTCQFCSVINSTVAHGPSGESAAITRGRAE
jgi:hypothetical protein